MNLESHNKNSSPHLILKYGKIIHVPGFNTTHTNCYNQCNFKQPQIDILKYFEIN
jgi:hypothetical protein